jgi:hypothetical protein
MSDWPEAQSLRNAFGVTRFDSVKTETHFLVLGVDPLFLRSNLYELKVDSD